jgi:hypothetical protein
LALLHAHVLHHGGDGGDRDCGTMTGADKERCLEKMVSK